MSDTGGRLSGRAGWPCTNSERGRIAIYPKILQSLTEWAPDAATRRSILQDAPKQLFGFA